MFYGILQTLAVIFVSVFITFLYACFGAAIINGKFDPLSILIVLLILPSIYMMWKNLIVGIRKGEL